jgi:hypothetical protein
MASLRGHARGPKWPERHSVPTTVSPSTAKRRSGLVPVDRALLPPSRRGLGVCRPCPRPSAPGTLFLCLLLLTLLLPLGASACLPPPCTSHLNPRSPLPFPAAPLSTFPRSSVCLSPFLGCWDGAFCSSCCLENVFSQVTHLLAVSAPARSQCAPYWCGATLAARNNGSLSPCVCLLTGPLCCLRLGTHSHECLARGCRRWVPPLPLTYYIVCPPAPLLSACRAPVVFSRVPVRAQQLHSAPTPTLAAPSATHGCMLSHCCDWLYEPYPGP